MKPNTRPKCPKCKIPLRNIFFRDLRKYINLGFYCIECNSIKVNSNIKLIKDILYIGLKEVKL